LILFAVAVSTPPTASWLHRFGRRPLNGRDLGEPGWPAAFDLQDTQGRRRTAADLRGRVALVTFGYTHCPDTCPTTLLRLAEVRKLLGKEADKVQVVFITIDPDRDSASLLGEYVGAFDSSFWALRGNSSQVDAAARAFHAEYHVSREGRDVLVEHTVDVFLVTPRGWIRDVLPPYLAAKQVADDVLAELRDSS
jgi:protein SCO1/2